jgi:CDP-paratose 2-epimerase
LRSLGVRVETGDVRNPADFEKLGDVDWVIDAAANPSVLAGVDGRTSSRELIEHNLIGTLNVLEFCKRVNAGLILLSTSRVYSIRGLRALPLVADTDVFRWNERSTSTSGASQQGIDIDFSTSAPLSLYGATKLASEVMALEYGEAFSLPVWIDRCGVIAGAGQFGMAEQGIFSYWIHSYAGKRPLKYIGFEGKQVRDALHPADLAEIIRRQMNFAGKIDNRIFNLGGGAANAMSLKQLSEWCRDRYGEYKIDMDKTERAFDVPWLVMDNSRAADEFKWNPQRDLMSILDEIAKHAEANPHWLELSAPK